MVKYNCSKSNTFKRSGSKKLENLYCKVHIFLLVSLFFEWNDVIIFLVRATVYVGLVVWDISEYLAGSLTHVTSNTPSSF